MHLFSTFFSLRTAALASIVLLGACSKKDDDTPAPATTTYATTWTADGTSYIATTSYVNVTSNELTIGALQTNSNKDTYLVSFVVPATTGTYNLNTSSNSGSYLTSVGGVSSTYAIGTGSGVPGNVTITTLSATEAIGTFSFTALKATNATANDYQKIINNGKFAIKR